MLEIKAPEKIKLYGQSPKLFLAGSIEQGTCVDWQSRIVGEFDENPHLTIYNPRRTVWDSSWEQSIDNPKFYEQVSWELDMLDVSDIIFMYFDPSTKSPITLLELGLYAHTTNKMIVCCPDGFWRKGNVEIVCQRYGIPVFNNMETALIRLKGLLN